MKFIIGRASLIGNEQPCDEAFKDKATYLSDCTAKTASKKELKEVWVVEIKSLEDLMEFIRKYEEVIISGSSFVEIPYRIMIYDDYVE